MFNGTNILYSSHERKIAERELSVIRGGTRLSLHDRQNRYQVYITTDFFFARHVSTKRLATRAERFSPKPNPGVTKIEIGGRTGARQGAHVRRRRRSSTHIIRTVFRVAIVCAFPGLFAKELLTDLITFDSLGDLAARILIDRESLLRLPFFSRASSRCPPSWNGETKTQLKMCRSFRLFRAFAVFERVNYPRGDRFLNFLGCGRAQSLLIGPRYR